MYLQISPVLNGYFCSGLNLISQVNFIITLGHWFKWWLVAEQATSHYLNQCWQRPLASYGITRPQWIIIDKGNSTNKITCYNLAFCSKFSILLCYVILISLISGISIYALISSRCQGISNYHADTIVVIMSFELYNVIILQPLDKICPREVRAPFTNMDKL